MKALIESAGGVASRVRLGSHELIFDQPHSIPGGQDRGPSPLEAMGAAVGACTHYFTAAVLHGRNVDPAGLQVEVEAEKVREPSPRFGKFSIRVRLPVGVPEHLVPVIERAVRRCPAYGTLLHSPELLISVSKGASDEDVPAAST